MSNIGSLPPTTSRTILCRDYTFDASAKTITVCENVDGFLLVVNAIDGIVIYNHANPGTTGTSSGQTLFLTYDTTSMSDTDDLLVFCELRDQAEPLLPVLEAIRDQITLMNARIEEAFDTGITEEDLL